MIPPELSLRMFERRVVLLRGPLDDELASRVATELMVLDASGDGLIELHVDSAGGSLPAAFTVIDTMDLLGVPVHTVCVGRAEGSAVGVVATGARRSAAVHARFRMCEPVVTASGTARELSTWADLYAKELARFVARLSAATGRPAEHLEAELAAGRWMDCGEAISCHLVDGVWGPARPGPGEPGRRLGFGPPS